MSKTIEVEGISIKNPDKNKNGDFYLSEHLNKEKLLILTLADGVGSKPCDWKASELACKNFIKSFKDIKGTIPERIHRSTIEANDEILFESISRCQGMKTTFSGVVWDYEKGIVHFINIGDSRIYIYEAGALKQISTDETIGIVMKHKDGNPVSSSGAIVVRDAITNALGTAGVSIKVESIKSDKCKAVVLASDGFYNCKPTFSNDISSLLDQHKMKDYLNNLFREYESFQSDDLTGLIARSRNKTINDNELERLIGLNEPPESIGIGKHEMATFVLESLKLSISKSKREESKNLLSYCEVFRIELGKENIGNLISLMLKVDFQDRDIYIDLLGKMRRSKT